MTRPYDAVKRLLDAVVAGVALVVTAPLQGFLGVMIRWRLGAPVFFRQPRPGKDGEIFILVKFRTMREPDQGCGLITDEDRLTRFGQFLRSTSLDELPTLWNVLRGSMSLVGPRPLLVQYLDRYTADQARRHEVRPGVTGLAQVSGRNALTWEAKFANDVDYVDRRSLRLDLAILARTVGRVMRRDGVNSDGVATMPEFQGSHLA